MLVECVTAERRTSETVEIDAAFGVATENAEPYDRFCGTVVMLGLRAFEQVGGREHFGVGLAVAA